MSTILRHSGRIARISQLSRRTANSTSIRISHLSPRPPSHTLRSQQRFYAAPPPKDPKNAKKSEGGKSDKKADKSSSSKSAPGTEHIYNGKKSPMSPSEGESAGEPVMKVTAEQAKDLDKLLAEVSQGLPKVTVEALTLAFEEMKKEGIPPEIQEILTSMKDGKPLSLVAAARVTRVATTMSWKKAAEDIHKEMNEKMKEGPKADANGSKTDFKQNRKPDPPTLDWNTFLVTCFATWLMYKTLGPGDSERDITFQEFRTTFLEKGLVEKLTVVNGNKVRVDLNRELAASMYPNTPAANPNFHYTFTIGSVESFERQLEQVQEALGIPPTERIPVAYKNESSMGNALIFSFGPTLVFLGGLIYLSRRAQGGGGASGIFNVGKSKAKMFNHETDIKVKFADVAGMDEAKQEIVEFVSFLKKPEQYIRLGAKIPRGAILSGPPGTGKTLLAKATAGESGVPFFSVSGSEFVEMFVGVGASRVRDLFKKARSHAPCIIFIDEIDAIGKARAKAGSFGGGNDEREGTLNQILTEMDGFNTSEQVVVLAGTNRPDVLDKALMRPGRFDRHISIDRPTMDGRKQIFLVHAKKITTDVDLQYLAGRLAALTPGFSGADIANCVNEAALIAARTNAKTVEMIHFEQAIERVIGGLEKKSKVLNPEEKRVVAYHEAGHAICGWYFKYADPLLKVSIIPRGQGALGYAQYLPAGDTYLMNVHQLMDRMAMTLGGRISEELHFETVTTGASDDFKKVTRMATAMVTQWGMSKTIGPLSFDDNENQLHKPFAESTAQAIDLEVRRFVDEAYKQCKDLLTEKKKEVGIVAEELLAKEVLGREDMIRLLGPRPFEDNAEFSKYFDGGSKSAPPPPPSEVDGPEDPEPGAPQPTMFK